MQQGGQSLTLVKKTWWHQHAGGSAVAQKYQKIRRCRSGHSDWYTCQSILAQPQFLGLSKHCCCYLCPGRLERRHIMQKVHNPAECICPCMASCHGSEPALTSKRTHAACPAGPAAFCTVWRAAQTLLLPRRASNMPQQAHTSMEIH
jgi:hypothetical protein